jgi:hypothetical protein
MFCTFARGSDTANANCLLYKSHPFCHACTAPQNNNRQIRLYLVAVGTSEEAPCEDSTYFRQTPQLSDSYFRPRSNFTSIVTAPVALTA